MKKEKLNLPEVTLLALTSVKLEETIQAMQYSMRQIKFADVVLLTHEKPAMLPSEIRYEQIDRIASIDDYNRAILYKVAPYVTTPFALCVQWDGYVVNPYQWRAEFLDYDYIGAPWPADIGFHDKAGTLVQVGNGGASLRSKRLLDAVADGLIGMEPEDNEDVFLCAIKRHLLEEHGFQIAPLVVAKYFAHERILPENKGIKPFMIHKWSGDNAQYPEFGAGPFKRCKKQVLRVLIRLHLDGVVNKLIGRNAGE